MGNSVSIIDAPLFCLNLQNIYIINTLPENKQNCLIKYTLPIDLETDIINKIDKNSKIVIYGINHKDKKPYYKFKQLQSLGYTNVFVYSGGLFEWILLNMIYGDKYFPLTSECYNPFNINT